MYDIYFIMLVSQIENMNSQIGTIKDSDSLRERL